MLCLSNIIPDPKTFHKKRKFPSLTIIFILRNQYMFTRSLSHMKSILFLLLPLSLFLSSCVQKVSPDDLKASQKEESLCTDKAIAVVEKMILNEDGTEYFLYLRLENKGSDALRFSKSIEKSNFEVGTRLEISYSPLGEDHSFIVCLPGHTLDTNNPDIQYMPMIKLCWKEEIPS